MSKSRSWREFKEGFLELPSVGASIDLSRTAVSRDVISSFEKRFQNVFSKMESLEQGEIFNPDENRMVGHYWLRNPALAPTPEIRTAIESTFAKIKEFSRNIHKGEITTPGGEPFRHLLTIGIGGSALGPQFVNHALRNPDDPIDNYFFDNTDPDGMERVLRSIPGLKQTLFLVISKSGGTKETRNGQLLAKAACERMGLEFPRQFVAITGEGSELDKTAIHERWLERFPMWDWVGGRTSELSAVGLVPAALQGFSIDRMIQGGKDMDACTQINKIRENPAALLALTWFMIGEGKGLKDMVVLPYSDRFELISRYLQQLIMESLGKELDLDGNVVNQGIAVYGNKGSTDQHAYVQQLRDGVHNFFVTFLRVLSDGKHSGESGRLEVEKGITAGDYLNGFLLGTREALFENGRESITITVREVSEYSVGALIALFERAVGYYAFLVNINAYHQPGVEAGKKAAQRVIDLQAKIVSALKSKGSGMTVEEIAESIGSAGTEESIFHIAERLAENGRVISERASTIFDKRYSLPAAR